MKLSAIIVDDEPLARSFLERYCEKSGNIIITGSYSNAEDALQHLMKNETDVVFLDVEMPGDSGFQLLDKLQVMPRIILTTSKTDYAYDAFQYNVTDYLKKPFSFVRFQEALAKVTEPKLEKRSSEKNEDIFIKSDGKLIRINYDEILFVESVGDYVKYCTADRKYITHSTLKAVEERLDKHYFMKVHRSYIVNLRKISNIEDYTLLIGDSSIPISKTLKSEVIGRINVAG